MLYEGVHMESNICHVKRYISRNVVKIVNAYNHRIIFANHSESILMVFGVSNLSKRFAQVIFN